MTSLGVQCLIATLIDLFMLYPAFANCPYQECTCMGDIIVCQDLGLSAIPQLTGSTTGFISLQLDTNHITTLPAGSLPYDLTDISLNENPLTNIDDAAFVDSSITLNSLTFSQARFTRIPNAFLYLQNLKYLSIYDTNILDWNEDAMKVVGSSMITLDLQNVGLTDWPDWLKYFKKLEGLTIDSSNISIVPDNALDFLATSLSDLSFTNGGLISVPMTFSKLVALEMLHLHGNRISNLTCLPQAKQLSTLSLSNNNIFDVDHLSAVLRPFGGALQYIDIHDNRLPAIPDFSFLKQISNLDLSYNRISNSNSGSLPPGIDQLVLSYNFLSYIPTVSTSLTETFSMNLPHNIIREIRGSDFHPNISEADLSYNLIKELTDTSFPLNFGLITLNLNNNPMTKISSHAFDNLHLLTSLNLANTKLARLPLAINSLVRLYILDMSDCSQLVCTCMEKSLDKKILSIGSVMGQCGETDIFFFYNIFSSACPS